MIKGILWDNDGVLVDTEHLFYAVNRDLLLEHGVALSEDDFFNWYLAENCGAWHILLQNGSTAEEVASLRDERNRRYTNLLLQEKILSIPGGAEVLDRFAARLPMGVVTSANRDHFDIIHARHDLLRHFQFVLTAEDYRDSKPSPEPYLLGLDRLGLTGADCLVVEDSPRGLQAARAAGIECIVLRNRLTAKCRFDGAYRVVNSMAELAREIDTLL
jgi:HAD superfamily hydrolase (TIGR01509 family)